MPFPCLRARGEGMGQGGSSSLIIHNLRLTPLLLDQYPSDSCKSQLNLPVLSSVLCTKQVRTIGKGEDFAYAILSFLFHAQEYCVETVIRKSLLKRTRGNIVRVCHAPASDACELRERVRLWLRCFGFVDRFASVLILTPSPVVLVRYWLAFLNHVLKKKTICVCYS